MAGNKIVPGLKIKDFVPEQYGQPKGTKMEQIYLKKKGWVKKHKPVNNPNIA